MPGHLVLHTCDVTAGMGLSARTAGDGGAGVEGGIAVDDDEAALWTPRISDAAVASFAGIRGTPGALSSTAVIVSTETINAVTQTAAASLTAWRTIALARRTIFRRELSSMRNVIAWCSTALLCGDSPLPYNTRGY